MFGSSTIQTDQTGRIDAFKADLNLLLAQALLLVFVLQPILFLQNSRTSLIEDIIILDSLVLKHYIEPHCEKTCLRARGLKFRI